MNKISHLITKEKHPFLFAILLPPEEHQGPAIKLTPEQIKRGWHHTQKNFKPEPAKFDFNKLRVDKNGN